MARVIREIVPHLGTKVLYNYVSCFFNQILNKKQIKEENICLLDCLLVAFVSKLTGQSEYSLSM